MKAIVIGGGVVGLMSALRLVRAGYGVTLFEAQKCGNGASTRNQGIIHSGAMYVRLHPEIVPLCIEAQGMFVRFFPEAHLHHKRSLYYGASQPMKELCVQWDHLKIFYDMVSEIDASEYFLETAGRMFAEVINESIFSAKRIIDILVKEAVEAGVKVYVNVPIAQIVHCNGRVSGVSDYTGRTYEADVVINTSGLGVKKFLKGINSHYQDSILSRLGSAVVMRNRRLDRVIVSTEFKGCNLAPANDGYLIVIIYGANQPWIHGNQRFCVIGEEYVEAMEKLRQTFRGDLYDSAVTLPYSCTKTEFINNLYADEWQVNPSYSVIDHKDDDIQGLFTCLPGKLTLAFHATRSIMAHILHQSEENVDLALPSFQLNFHEPSNLVAIEPWKIMGENEL